MSAPPPSDEEPAVLAAQLAAATVSSAAGLGGDEGAAATGGVPAAAVPPLSVDTGSDCTAPCATAPSGPASAPASDVYVPRALNGPTSAGFHRWLSCLVCVTFDLSLGPALECMYPPGQLTPDEVTNVCSLSFPDSHCAQLGDSSFCFRMRMQADRQAKLAAAAAEAAAVAAAAEAASASLDGRGGGGDLASLPASLAPPTLTHSISTPERLPSTTSRRLSAGRAGSSENGNGGSGAGTPNKHYRSHLKFLSDNQSLLFGYVLFRQRRDDSNARGFFQKSVVLLSPLPAVEAFTHVVARIGRAFFLHGPPVLEMAARQVASWPSPYPGRRICLPLLGESIHEQLPYYSPLSPHAATTTMTARAMGQFPTVPSAVSAVAATGASTMTTTIITSEWNSSASSSGGGSVAASSNHVSVTDVPPLQELQPAGAAAVTSADNAAVPPTHPRGSSAVPGLPILAAGGGNLALAASQAVLTPGATMSPLTSPPASPSLATGSLMLQHPHLHFQGPSASASTAGSAAIPPHHHPHTHHVSPASMVVAQPQALGWFQGIPLFESFGRAQLANLWYCWELVLCGEAMLVVAASPSSVSQIVLALVSLIAPVVYRGDYRPFFTIYDPDYRYYSQLHDLGKLSSSPVILGVTNPFFLKTMGEKFPHILCFGDDAAANAQQAQNGGGRAAPGAGTDVDSLEDHNGFMAVPLSPSSSAGGSLPPSPAAQSGGGYTKITSKLSSSVDVLHVSTAPSQFISSGTPLLAPDEATLKRLVDIHGRSSSSSSATSAAVAVPGSATSTLASSGGGSAFSSSAPASSVASSAGLPVSLSPPFGPLPTPHTTKKPSVYVEAEQDGLAAAEAAAALSANAAAAAAPISDSDSKFLADINNAILRKAFASLTQLFLAPFMPYVTFTPEQQRFYAETSASDTDRGQSSHWNPYGAPQPMPGSGAQGVREAVGMAAGGRTAAAAAAAAAVAASGGYSLSAGQLLSTSPPSLPRFVEEEFLVRVIGGLSSAQLSLFPLSGLSSAQRRAKLQRLYEKFIKSVNFFPWFHELRERALAQVNALISLEVKRLYLAGDAAFFRFLDGVRVQEAVDMFKRAQAMLERTLHQPSSSASSAGAADLSSAHGRGGGSAAAAAADADIALQQALQHHLHLIQSVLPPSQQALLAAWQGERLSMLSDSKRKRLEAAAAAPLPTRSPSLSPHPTPTTALPLPVPGGGAGVDRHSVSPLPNTGLGSASGGGGAGASASPSPQRNPPRAAPAAHPHSPALMQSVAATHLARSSSGSPARSPARSITSTSALSSSRGRTGSMSSSSSRSLGSSSSLSSTDRMAASSPEQRTAGLVAVPKSPLQMTIADNYF